MKTSAIVAVVIVAVIGLATMIALPVYTVAQTASIPNAGRNEILEREDLYDKAKTHRLGEHIAEHFPNATVLLITGPANAVDAATKRRRVNEFEGFTKGLGNRATLKATVAATAKANTLDPSEDYEFTATFFDSTIQQHSGCTVVVSLIGLPSDMYSMKYWSLEPEQRPKLLLANASVYELEQAIKTGMVEAAIAYNPNYKYDVNDAPKDKSIAFRARYLFIHATTVDKIAPVHPDLFMAR